MTMHAPLVSDDDFLFDDGLPCLRRDGRLYYLNDVQPRVLEACRRFGLGFEQLADKLGLQRPALVLILKGYDPVSLPLKSMLDRLVAQAELQLADVPAAAAESTAQVSVSPVPQPAPSVTPRSEPGPDARGAEAAEGRDPAPVAKHVEQVVIPDVVAAHRPAAPHVVSPVLDARLSGYTPGLRRMGRRSRRGKRVSFC